MPFDSWNTPTFSLDVKEILRNLHPYGNIWNLQDLQSDALNLFETLDENEKSRVQTLAARIQTMNQTEQLNTLRSQWNRFWAETLLIWIIEWLWHIKKEDTKLEYLNAASHLLDVLWFPAKLDITRTQYAESISNVL